MSKNPKLGCESQDVRTEFFDARGWGGFPNPLWSRKSLCDPIENHKATCWGAWMLGAGRLANSGKIYFWAFNLCLRRCFSTSYVPHLAVAGKLDKGNRNWANGSERGVEKFFVCWFVWPWILGCFVTSSLGICVIYWRLAENQWQVYHGASCSAGWACIPLRANTVKHSTLVDFQGLLCVQTLRTPACFWDSTLKTRAMTQGSLWARRQWLSFPSAAMSSPNLVQQLDTSFIVHPGPVICLVQLKQMHLNLQTDVSLEIFITGFVLVWPGRYPLPQTLNQWSSLGLRTLCFREC